LVKGEKREKLGVQKEGQQIGRKERGKRVQGNGGWKFLQVGGKGCKLGRGKEGKEKGRVYKRRFHQSGEAERNWNGGDCPSYGEIRKEVGSAR